MCVYVCHEGKYIVMPNKIPEIVVPDLTGFEVGTLHIMSVFYLGIFV